MSETTWRDILAALVPAGVVVEVAELETTWGEIYPEEEASVRGAAMRRRQEFAAGRLCARRALDRLGVPGGPIPVGRRGEPLWPEGVVGGISHCSNYCGVVVARDTCLAGIGLDLECVDDVRPELWRHICTPDELRQLYALPDGQRRSVAAVIFSAKESAYKCQYPLTGQWLDFSDVAIHVDAHESRCMVHFIRAEHPACPTELEGRYVVCDGLVATAVAIRDPHQATVYG
jgi:4'-phosphopantetheinyl transferase EntD